MKSDNFELVVSPPPYPSSGPMDSRGKKEILACAKLMKSNTRHPQKRFLIMDRRRHTAMERILAILATGRKTPPPASDHKKTNRWLNGG